MIHLISYAFKFIGIPYKWGGSNPLEGFDCSGFVQWILQACAIDPPGDQTAQALYDYFSKNCESIAKEQPGALAFYGKSFDKIIHVGFCVNEFFVIEAGGGGHTTLSRADAEKSGACVRLRPLRYRKDYLTTLMPKYPPLIGQFADDK